MKGKRTTFLVIFLLCSLASWCQSSTIGFRVAADLAAQAFVVSMELSGVKQDTLVLKMPAWTPGYYQLLHFADHVSNFSASEAKDGSALTFAKSGRNTWKVVTRNSAAIRITYRVVAKRTFVATPFVVSDRAYLSPPGVFMHVAGDLKRPATVTLDLPKGWTAATGLEPIGREGSKFLASDFDVLYDSPILMGELEELPSFKVNGINHRFVGYKPGDFDKAAFMDDLKKIVEQAVAIIGEIPYKEYTFIAIGPGPGGIEHLNSTSFGFSGESMKTREGRIRMYAFLAHEYFHHYNVKRIRPVELGPFDYDRENRTNMLWVAEGFTVYYDLLLTYRAGLMTREELFAGISSRIASYENKPGKRYQSATQASYNTWSDGPFGRTDDEVNKTVSVYDKGAALGLLLDFAIRQSTANAKSLDDVMRQLYKEYYKGKKRGFTEAEFRSVAEQVAGHTLAELFDYASTTQQVDYRKYFAYAGLSIESDPTAVSGGWLGISTRPKGDSLLVSQVDYESPAWQAGIRRGMTLLAAGKPALEPVIRTSSPGTSFTVTVKGRGEVTVILGVKQEASFAISPSANPTPAQQKILESWLSGRPHGE